LPLYQLLFEAAIRVTHKIKYRGPSKLNKVKFDKFVIENQKKNVEIKEMFR